MNSGTLLFVIKEADKVIAYLFGFLSQTQPAGYVHLIGVRDGYKGKGYGKQLYKHFISFLKEKGCNKLKAITKPSNAASIGFHKAIGMHLTGEKNIDGIEVIKDYSGPGEDRVVFEMDI